MAGNRKNGLARVDSGPSSSWARRSLPAVAQCSARPRDDLAAAEIHLDAACARRSRVYALRLLLRVQVGQRQVAPLHERADILGAAPVRVALERASAVDGLKLGDGRLRRVEAE